MPVGQTVDGEGDGLGTDDQGRQVGQGRQVMEDQHDHSRDGEDDSQEDPQRRSEPGLPLVVLLGVDVEAHQLDAEKYEEDPATAKVDGGVDGHQAHPEKVTELLRDLGEDVRKARCADGGR